MTALDWWIVGAYVAAVWLVGFSLSRRASGSTEDYFASGRHLPWWLIGTSMAASAFSSDTPHYVARIVREHGVARNWEWWGLGVGGVVVGFVVAPLWRRVGVLTDVELIEARYPGRSAAVLRGFRAIHTGLFFNVITMAAPLAGMLLVLEALGVQVAAIRIELGAALVAATLLYSFFGGFWGVVVTDFLQFAIAMAAAVVVAVLALDRAGGLSAAVQAAGGAPALVDTRVPDGDPWSEGLLPLVVFAGVQWWAYLNADGGGKMVQRMIAARDETHAVWGTMWFNLTHYALRTWPWVLVGLASLVIAPDVEPRLAYAVTSVRVLPPGLLGLFVVSFVAAYMSTVDTQLNWGASYLVHDFYRRFLVREKSERHYVAAARLATLLLAAGAVAMLEYGDGGVTVYLRTAVQATMGYGVALLARWFWWRATAAGEIAAMGAAFAITIAGRAAWPDAPYARMLALTAAGTLLVWYVAVALGPKPDRAALVGFYRRARPPGLWGPVAALAPDVEARGAGRAAWRKAAGGLLLVFGSMLGLGAFLLRGPWEALAWLALAGAGAGLLLKR